MADDGRQMIGVGLMSALLFCAIGSGIDHLSPNYRIHQERMENDSVYGMPYLEKKKQEMNEANQDLKNFADAYAGKFTFGRYLRRE